MAELDAEQVQDGMMFKDEENPDAWIWCRKEWLIDTGEVE